MPAWAGSECLGSECLVPAEEPCIEDARKELPPIGKVLLTAKMGQSASKIRKSLAGHVAVVLRYADVVATALDKDKLHDVLDQAVIVIDERDLERSRRDPRVRAFHESADQLLAELEAEGADYC